MATSERSQHLPYQHFCQERNHNPVAAALCQLVTVLAIIDASLTGLANKADCALRAAADRLVPGLGGSRLRNFRVERLRAGCTARNYLGLQTVPVRAIVGSVDRATDYDAAFRPRLLSDRRRTARVRRLMEQDHPLPAVELLRLGYDYYVLDGHHRIVAAKQLGREFVDAEVTDYPLPTAEVAVPATPKACPATAARPDHAA